MEIKSDLDTLFRRMRLKLHFADTPENTGDPFQEHLERTFRNKGTWTPSPNADIFLDTFIEATKQDFDKLTQRNMAFPKNLTNDEYKILDSLKNDENIIIKKADKGAATILMDKTDYIKEGERQLSDTSFYIETPSDYTQSHIDYITNVVMKIHQRGEIPLSIMKNLIPSGARCANWYFLPKIHKAKITGRPIVSGNNSPTEKISSFIDEHIKGLVPKIPSYVRDTPDFIKKVENFHHNGDFLLVTMDVTSLYTNIPNQEGLIAIARTLIREKPVFNLQYNSLLELLKIVLHKNNFQFNGKHYLQIGGTAMGTKVAPSYANLFMAYLEQKLLEKAKKDLHIVLPLYLRYIDDIFFVFPECEQRLSEFMQMANSFHTTIKFTEEHSTKQVIFLDTIVKKRDSGLYTDLFVKETATHSYLMYDSCHPPHCVRKGPYSQFLRIRRNCKLDDDFERHASDMKQHYKARKYPDKIIREAYEKAKSQPHETLIHNDAKKDDDKDNLPFITNYRPNGPNVMNIIRKHWPLLHLSEECKQLFPKAPVLAYRRNQNLKDILVKANLTPKPIPKTQIKCNKQNCKFCEELKSHQTLQNIKTKTVFNAHLNVHCKIYNVVYVLECNNCKKHYVGETKRNFVIRWKEHLRSIIKNTETPVARHYNNVREPACKTFHAMIVSRIKGHPDNTTGARRNREKWWIKRLDSYYPTGINVKE